MEIISSEMGEIRVQVNKNNEVLFVAKDICNALGIVNSRDAVNSLDDDEKMSITVKVNCVSGKVGVCNTDTKFRNQEVTAVTESGMYKLIFQSRKPQAKKFTKWVTSEVLPSIRKYGCYSTDEAVMSKVKERARAKAVKKLMERMEDMIGETDIRLIAKSCNSSKDDVFDVLRGLRKDVTMTAMIYQRATSVKMLEEKMFSLEGAEKLLKELEK